MSTVLEKKVDAVPYPGIPTTADGAACVVWVETNITQGGCAYPITSSTTMGAGYQAEVANGKKNLWDEPLQFVELESEHSSASTCEGFAAAGGRVTNFTSGQGLILMKEVLFAISGKRLPAVFHIGARAMTSQSLNVHAGHDDVMGVADCGWGMLFARNAQEVCDIALIARRTAENSQTPFFNVQDGFLTTHTIENVLLPEPELMKNFVGNPAGKLKTLMDPDNPLMSGVVQNQDSYMKGKIAQRYFCDEISTHLKNAMQEFTRLTGREYGLIDCYRMDDAEYAIVGLGSYMETAETVADYYRDKKGVRAGVVHVTSFRPFPAAELVGALGNCKAITVLERMDNPIAQSNPLTAEIKAAFHDAATFGLKEVSTRCGPMVYSGAGGLGSRDVRPQDFAAIIENMQKPDGKPFFVINIKHPLAITTTEDIDVRSEGTFSMRGHSVGGYGSVTTNKIIATIAGDVFGLKVQAYPKYGSEKKGLPTTYYLSISENRIRTHCELELVDFVPMNDINAFNYGNPLSGIAVGGMIFLQTYKTEPGDIWNVIPAPAQKTISEKKIKVYGLNTVGIARELSPSEDLEMRMQGIVLLGVFLRVTPFKERYKLTDDQIFQGVEKALNKYFGKKGKAVVEANLSAVKRGFLELIEVPQSIVNA